MTQFTKRAILIGRHASQGLPYDEIDQRGITFPTDKVKCILLLEDLIDEAFEKRADIIFQNVPGIVACALTYIGVRNPPNIGIGVIISVPGEREAEVEYTFDDALFNRYYEDDAYCEEVQKLALHCNPNAKVDCMTVTVDPPMKFKFSHIEWMF